jgi:pilus assembly protein Flp/PilA
MAALHQAAETPTAGVTRKPLPPRGFGFSSQLGTGAGAMKNDFGAHFFKNQSGTTAIEYSLIAALISVVCIAGMILVGNGLQNVYNAVSAAITPAL